MRVKLHGMPGVATLAPASRSRLTMPPSKAPGHMPLPWTNTTPSSSSSRPSAGRGSAGATKSAPSPTRKSRRIKLMPAAILPIAEHEIEAGVDTVAGLRGPHQQLLAKQAVAAVCRLVREIKLGGQQPSCCRLNLQVKVAGAAGIDRRHDGAEAVAALGVGVLVAAQSETRVVVVAGVVGLPQVEQRMRHRLAGRVEHEAGELDRAALHAGLDQVGALGRARLEERPFGLARRRLVAVMAGGRGGEPALAP